MRTVTMGGNICLMADMGGWTCRCHILELELGSAFGNKWNILCLAFTGFAADVLKRPQTWLQDANLRYQGLD